MILGAPTLIVMRQELHCADRQIVRRNWGESGLSAFGRQSREADDCSAGRAGGLTPAGVGQLPVGPWKSIVRSRVQWGPERLLTIDLGRLLTGEQLQEPPLLEAAKTLA